MDNILFANNYSNQLVINVGDSTICEYVWVDGSGQTLRAKARTITKDITCLEDLPEWNYDGSSCY